MISTSAAAQLIELIERASGVNIIALTIFAIVCGAAMSLFWYWLGGKDVSRQIFEAGVMAERKRWMDAANEENLAKQNSIKQHAEDLLHFLDSKRPPKESELD